MQVTICCRDQNAQPSVARIELVRCLVRVALAIGSGASEAHGRCERKQQNVAPVLRR